MADLRNHIVRFKISDIHIPEPQVVLQQLHGNDLLQGRVVDISDSGTQKEKFIVVEVHGVRQLIVVPADRIDLVGD